MCKKIARFCKAIYLNGKYPVVKSTCCYSRVENWNSVIPLPRLLRCCRSLPEWRRKPVEMPLPKPHMFKIIIKNFVRIKYNDNFAFSFCDGEPCQRCRVTSASFQFSAMKCVMKLHQLLPPSSAGRTVSTFNNRHYIDIQTPAIFPFAPGAPVSDGTLGSKGVRAYWHQGEGQRQFRTKLSLLITSLTKKVLI